MPTQHDLIPNLGVLDRLLEEKSSDSEGATIDRVTEQLPYYLKGAFSALTQMELARIKAVETLDDPMFKGNSQFNLPPEYIDPLSFALDSYLFCMRRVADSLIPYIQRCPNKFSLPSSMTKLIKKIKEDKLLEIDSIIRDALLQYWNKVGWKLTGYRDQANHTAIIISNCVVFRYGEGKKGLKALLPDDPKEKRPSKIRYDQEILLMRFTLDGFMQLTQLVNILIERMIDLFAPENPDARLTGIVKMVVRGGPMVMKLEIVGEPTPFPANIKNIISNAVACKYAIPETK